MNTGTPEFPIAVRRARLLRPRLTADLVPRSRLVRRLNRGLDRPLIVLTTPAGFGKTTLLCEWLAQCAAPSAWLSLDDEGDDLAGFVSHLVGAIRTVAPRAGAETLGLLRLTELPAPAVIASVLDDELLDLTDDLIVVLDDYHTIDDRRVHEFLSALLSHPPPSLHIAIATRVDPPLPLARLRARGQLVELRAADLRFTADETLVFFARSANVSLDPITAAVLEERSEGWVAGLRLAALSLEGGEDPATVLAAFEGRRLGGVMAYLSDEILGRQPPEVQEFLLTTSILDRLCAPLCDALLASDGARLASQTMLERVIRANLYLVPLGEAGWYRYHQLFRDVLRGKLQAQAGDSGVSALHARASAWFAGHGLIDDAIRHALAAGDGDLAATLVEENAHGLLDRELWFDLDDWLRLLPSDLLNRRPRLVMAQAWIARFRDNLPLHGRLLDTAAALVEQSGTAMRFVARQELRGELAALRCSDAFYRGDFAGAIVAAQAALLLLPANRSLVRGIALYHYAISERIAGRGAEAMRYVEALLAEAGEHVDAFLTRALLALAFLQLQAGALPEAQRTATRLRVATGEGAFPLSSSWAHYLLGVMAYETNELDLAVQHFSHVITHQHGARAASVLEGTFGLSLAYQAQGRPADAEAVIARELEVMGEMAGGGQRDRLQRYEARLALLQGDLDEAAGRLKVEMPLEQRSIAGLQDDTRSARVRVLIALGTSAALREAEELLAGHLALERTGHRVNCVLEALALQSLLCQAQGRTDDALAALRESIALAAPGGFIRTFVDLGPPMARLLRMLRGRVPHTAYIDRILAAFPERVAASDVPAPATGAGAMSQAAPSAADELLDALTNREFEILNLLQERLSNKEIAQELVISPLTVKVHASNIYSKLGVAGRREAIRKARALGLLLTR